MMLVIKRHPTMNRALVIPDAVRGFRNWKRRVKWVSGGDIPLNAKEAPRTLTRLVESWNGRR